MKSIFLVLICGVGVLAYTFHGQTLLRKRAEGPPPADSSAVSPEAERQVELGASPGTSVYWQYVDGTGRVRFAASRDDIPAEWRQRAGRIEMSAPPVPTPEVRPPAPSYAALQPRSDPPGPPPDLPPAAGRDPDIEIYTTRSCGYCRAAMAYMREIGVSYTNYDVQEDEFARQEYLEKTGGRPGVPVIDIDGEIMQGWDRRHFDALLGAARRS